jgi:hypothetical protein
MSEIYYWIDLIWLPLGLLIAQKGQRFWTISFLLCSMLMMRMLVELMESIGYKNGIAGILSSDVFDRAIIVYSIFYMLFLILVHYSPGARGAIFYGSAISIFFMAFFTSTLIMLL